MPDSPSTARVLTRRGFGFVVAPLVSILAFLVVLPVLARTATINEFASIALGQSIGAVATLVVSYGWTVTGPADVARADPARRPLFWIDSLRMRLVAFGVVLLPTSAIALALDPAHSWLAPGLAIATAFAGFSPGWYSIGLGQPSIVVWFDAVPKIAGNLVGVVLAASLDNLWWYAAAIAIASTVPIVVFDRRCRAEVPADLRGQRSGITWRANLAPTLTEVTAGLYSLGSTALVAGSITSARTVGVFSGGERLTRGGSAGIVVVSSALTAWVAEAHGRVFRRRVTVSLLAHTALGLLGAAILTAFGPALTALLLGDRFELDRTASFAFGVFYLGWSLETVTARHILAARRRNRVLLISTIIGSATGCVAVVVGSAVGGAAGAATGLAIGIFTVIVCQVPTAWRVVRHDPDQAAPDSDPRPDPLPSL